MGVPDPELLADLGNIWGGNTMGAGGASSIMNLGGTPAVASDAAIANMNAGATDPFGGSTMDSTWWDRNMPSKQQVTDALGSLGAANKAAQAGKGAGTTPQQAALGGGAGARQGQASLAPLLQMLMQRRNALLQSATAGPGGQARPQGLLGL